MPRTEATGFGLLAAACLSLSCGQKGEVAPPPGKAPDEGPPSLVTPEARVPAAAAAAPEPVEFRPAHQRRRAAPGLSGTNVGP